MRACVLAVCLLSACAPALPVQRLSANIDRAQQSGILMGSSWEGTQPSFAWAFPRLVAFAELHHYTVEVVNIRQYGFAGMNYFAPIRLIQIDDSMSVNHQVSTLVHELAHIFQPQELPKGFPREVFAEAVAMYACEGFGLNTRRETYSYLAGVPMPMREAVLNKYAVLIQKVSTEIAVYVKPQE